MLFAHLKRILELDRLRLRGLGGACADEFLLAATAQNLRRKFRRIFNGIGRYRPTGLEESKLKAIWRGLTEDLFRDSLRPKQRHNTFDLASQQCQIDCRGKGYGCGSISQCRLEHILSQTAASAVDGKTMLVK